MQPKDLFRSVAILEMSFAPFLAQADVVHGTTMGSTVMAPALTLHPNNRDDTDVASTINVTFLTTSPFITADAGRFPTFNFVFAALSPGGEAFAPPVGLDVGTVDAGDFTIDQYKPWVVDNNATTNNITDPSGANRNRAVTGQDAGGADIVISYTPLNNSDPTSVNFLQAFIENFNGGGPSTGTIDTRTASPYHNSGFVAGTGMTDRTGTVPLETNKTTAAWEVDIPFDCENGPIPPGGTDGCLGGVDEVLLSSIVTFQTFIESDKTCTADACGDNKGKTYQVLYGGVQWGYTYTNADTLPEPSYAVLLAFGLAAVWLGRRFRRSRRIA